MGRLWQILYRVLSFEEVSMLECVLHCVELTLSGEGFGESKDSQLHPCSNGFAKLARGSAKPAPASRRRGLTSSRWAIRAGQAFVVQMQYFESQY